MPTKVNTIPYSKEELHDFFRYDPETGKLFWKVSRGRIKIGDEAGSLTHGYLEIGLYGSSYKVHRIIAKMFFDEFDESLLIDHQNGIKNDNRLSNLRMVSNQENLKNQGFRSNNKSGYVGICWYERYGMWKVQTMVNGKQIYGGRYLDINDAIKARDELYKKHGFHPNHGRKISV